MLCGGEDGEKLNSCRRTRRGLVLRPKNATAVISHKMLFDGVVTVYRYADTSSCVLTRTLSSAGDDLP